MKPVSKGVTKKFVKLRDTEAINELVNIVTDNFTGRIQGVLKTPKGDLDVVIEIENGKVVAAGVDGYTSKLSNEALAEILNVIPQAEGFLEIIELSKEAVSLDLEFNPNAKLRKEIEAKELVKKIIDELKKIAKPTETAEKEKTEEKYAREPIDINDMISKLNLGDKLDEISSALIEDVNKLVSAITKSAKSISRGQTNLEELLIKQIHGLESSDKPLMINLNVGNKVYSILVLDGKIRASFTLKPSKKEVEAVGRESLKQLIKELWGKSFVYSINVVEDEYILSKIGIRELKERGKEERVEEYKEKPKGILSRLKRMFGLESK